jgi:CRP-like cAMP-binding protein
VSQCFAWPHAGPTCVLFRAVDAEAIARVLARAPVFSALSDTERTELVSHVRARRFSRDEVVFHRDDPAGHLYVTLAREDFLRMLERSPRATREILRLLARTVRRASGRIEDLVFLDVPGRVAKCLLDLATAHARTEVELTQDDLAAFVGATRVSVNRALADLESQGAIAVGRRHISVKDPTLLRQAVRY